MPRTLLIFSQAFIPDPASIGQHLADVAFEMATRGYQVIVYTARRSCGDPRVLYPKRERIRGVEIRRLAFASSSGESFLRRRVGAASFMLQAVVHAGFTMDLAGVLFSTSPHLVGFAATIVSMFRTVPIAYWATDLNPDHLIALGKLAPTDTSARFLESANRMILRSSSLVIALDRFMAERLKARARLRLEDKMVVIPPWAHDDVIEPVPHESNPFRRQHGLEDKFVIMHSGNHAASNPLGTLLEAALRLRDRDDIRFVFIGGGIGKRDVERFKSAHALSNMLLLPHEPLETLRYSLSSADVHVVSLGEQMAGIIHPSKLYGAISAGRPILYLGPRPSPVSDLLDHQAIGHRVAHGDVDGAVDAILTMKAAGRERLGAMGRTARELVLKYFSRKRLCNRFCDGLQTILR